MHDFKYVLKDEAKPIEKELYQILNEVQNLVRDKFTFSFATIGSSSRNMITYDTKSDIGFDFDINIEVNVDGKKFTPDEIRNTIRNAINLVAPRYGYLNCDDSTRVLTIKKWSYLIPSVRRHSCDFAIVYKQQYIRFNKKQNYYSWEYQGKGFADLDKKISWLKRKGLWGELRDYYIEKKNSNNNHHKHSRSIFAEAINEMCHKNGFHNKS